MNGDQTPLETQGTATPRSGPLAAALTAVAFLTRLPLPRGLAGPGALEASLAWFPLAGALVGSLAAAALAGAALLWPSPLPALAAVAMAVLVTGGFHEDGLADTADGLGGGRTRERKLEIMRDSRIGTYGVLALIVAVGLKWVALATLAAQSVWLAFAVIVAAAAVSRVAPAAVLHLLPPARRDGLSADTGRPGRSTVMQALAVATFLSIVLLWPVSLVLGLVIVPVAGIVGLAGMVWLARRQIGGQTGDVAGASQVVSEATILTAAVMMLAP